MPIHYEQLDGHVARITIDRPEARNSARPPPLPRPGQRVAPLPRRPGRLGGRSSPASTGNFMSGADLKTYIPQITELQKQISRRRRRRDRRLQAQRRHRRRAAQPPASTSRSSPPSTGPAWPAAWRCSAASTSASPRERSVFGVMEPKRGLFAGGGTTVRLPRQIPFPAAMEFLLTAEAFPAERALELGLLNEIVPAGPAAGPGARLGPPHHRQRAAGRAGHQGERAARPGRPTQKEAFAIESEMAGQGVLRARTPRRARRRSPRSATPSGRAADRGIPRL